MAGKRYITSGQPSARLASDYGRHAVPTTGKRHDSTRLQRKADRERTEQRNALYGGPGDPNV